MTRGIRGAITVDRDDPADILAATTRLLEAITRENGLRPEEVCSAIFTVTPDLSSTFPAEAARRLGWEKVPLLCSTEIPVAGSLPRCVRVLLHWNTDLAQHVIRHVYLDGAVALRPDISHPEVAQ
ncbi:MAG TPA: chorismate mutase [Candidatus Dormibacteraeota bacterium]|nr:chorismate mutase [Candidatus Dormibacteraeota bacterium]